MEGVGVVMGVIEGPNPGAFCPGRFSPTPEAKIFPASSMARAVISFFGALYSTNASPAGEIR